MQLVGALVQNRLEIFSGAGLCAVPRSNISHPEEEQVVATSVLGLFGRAKGSFIRHEDGFAGIWHDSIRGHVTSRHGHSHVSHV